MHQNSAYGRTSKFAFLPKHSRSHDVQGFVRIAFGVVVALVSLAGACAPKATGVRTSFERSSSVGPPPRSSGTVAPGEAAGIAKARSAAPNLGKDAVIGKAATGSAPEDSVSLENAGACLEPAAVWDASAGDGLKREMEALGLGAPGSVAAMFVVPSDRAPWMVSLHRRSSGAYFFRVARVGQEGAPKERPTDGQTARLFEALWKTLVEKAQVVPSNTGALHGTTYRLWHAGNAGFSVSPAYGSILERTTFAAEWLAKMVEQPRPSDADDLKYVRAELSDALARAKKGEACSRSVKD